MPQRFRMGNPHTDREIDALWREIHRAQRQVQTVEAAVVAATVEPEVPPPSDDFSDSQVLIDGGVCQWPTRCYMLPVWNFTESDLTSQFTHPAQWAVWAEYRDDLYRTIVLDLHEIQEFYNPGAGSKTWHEETGSPNPYQAIWQEAVGDDSYEVRQALTGFRVSQVALRGTAGDTWVWASCSRARRWRGFLNGAEDGQIGITQSYIVRSDIDNPDPLACSDIPAAINAGGLPDPIAYAVALTSTVSWIPSVQKNRVYAHIHVPETAVAA